MKYVILIATLLFVVGCQPNDVPKFFPKPGPLDPQAEEQQ